MRSFLRICAYACSICAVCSSVVFGGSGSDFPPSWWDTGESLIGFASLRLFFNHCIMPAAKGVLNIQIVQLENDVVIRFQDE